jgi:hypothetical protein
MADRNRRFTLAAIALPLLLVAMSGMAHAATFTVSNTLDSGVGSLRDAIRSANAAPTETSTINFSVSGTITLSSELPAVANTSPGSLTIDGSGQAITVDGNGFRPEVRRIMRARPQGCGPRVSGYRYSLWTKF